MKVCLADSSAMMSKTDIVAGKTYTKFYEAVFGSVGTGSNVCQVTANDPLAPESLSKTTALTNDYTRCEEDGSVSYTPYAANSVNDCDAGAGNCKGYDVTLVDCACSFTHKLMVYDNVWANCPSAVNTKGGSSSSMGSACTRFSGSSSSTTSTATSAPTTSGGATS